jgi:UDP-N-acetyl-D-mannosaminuronic acid dehydrogenase
MKKICIIGGCGHVGIPLGLALASASKEDGENLFDVTLLDINEATVKSVNSAKLPFVEEGAEEILKGHLGKNLSASTDISAVARQDVIIFVTGTPVDEHHTPKISEVSKVVKQYLPLMRKEQLIILRSTVFPGTTELIESLFERRFGLAKVAFCPERILQGKGIEEIFKLPQIISASSESAFEEASSIFSKIAPKIIKLIPKEAELVKLITNTWRYLEFAASNAFYMMCENEGIDFYRVFDAIKDDYPRAAHFPSAGFAAGPCLFKDTMQLSAFYRNSFFLGQAAMLVNEGLPEFIIKQLEDKIGAVSPKTDKSNILKGKKIALLGMTFKANNDDTRESLSFKVKKLLEFRAATVLTHDPYLNNELSLEETLKNAHGIILGTPHKEYKNIVPQVPYVDCWGFWRNRK